MILISAIADWWLGLCRKPPAFHTAPAVLMASSETMQPSQPDGGELSGRSGRVRLGISIAAGSLKTMVRERHMLWFSLISGLLMSFLFALIYWTRGNVYYDPFLIRILLGDFTLWFDPRLILILTFCLFCFTFLMAGLIKYRNLIHTDHPITIREGLSGARAHAVPLAVLSFAMALAGTILIAFVTSDRLADISIRVEDFFMPYIWFLPDSLGLSITFWLMSVILCITIILFLAIPYVVPVIVLENKGLVSALAGSITLIRKTWREILGCILVYGTIVLLAGAISLIMNQFLIHYNYDPVFWYTHNLIPIAALVYDTVLFCFVVLMAVCSMAVGVTVGDLYRIGKSGKGSGIPEGNRKQPEPAS